MFGWRFDRRLSLIKWAAACLREADNRGNNHLAGEK